MKYLIVNTESFSGEELPEHVQKYIDTNKSPFIILDESTWIKTNHACKEEKKSKRNRCIRKLNTVGQRCIMTGTFISKSPVNAFDQMDFLKKGFFEENMYQFESRYCIMMTLPIGRGVKNLISEEVYDRVHRKLNKAFKTGGEVALQQAYESVFNSYKIGETKQQMIMAKEEYTPFIRLDELYERIGDNLMIVKKKDALDMAPKTYITRKVVLTEEAKELYSSLLNQGFTEEIVIDNTLSLYHRFQDICNGYIPYDDEETGKVRLKRQTVNVKIEELLECLEEIDTSTYQVVVWANRKAFLKDIYQAVLDAGYTAGLFDGDTKADEKARIEKEFPLKKIQVFIGNQQSGAFGLDWLKKAGYAIYMSNDNSVERREQSEERIDREEGTESKIIIDIVTEGTIDEKVQSNLLLGKELIKSGKTDKSIFALF